MYVRCLMDRRLRLPPYLIGGLASLETQSKLAFWGLERFGGDALAQAGVLILSGRSNECKYFHKLKSMQNHIIRFCFSDDFLLFYSCNLRKNNSSLTNTNINIIFVILVYAKQKQKRDTWRDEEECCYEYCMCSLEVFGPSATVCDIVLLVVIVINMILFFLFFVFVVIIAMYYVYCRLLS